MSRRTKSVNWLEGKIIEELSKRQVASYLSLSSKITRNNTSVDEQHNLDIAFINLIAKKQIFKRIDDSGMTVLKAVA